MNPSEPAKCPICGNPLIVLNTTCQTCNKVWPDNELVLTMCRANEDLQFIRESLTQFSTFYVDWEKLYFEAGYHPEFPKHLSESLNALARLRKTILKYANLTQ